MSCGLAAVDSLLAGGLVVGGVHECAASWPPLSIVTHLADRLRGNGTVLWLGRWCWPDAGVLYKAFPGLMRASLRVQAPDSASRWWAAEVAAQSGATVILDGRRMPMTASRRLHLAATDSAVVVLCTLDDLHRRSAATTRWRIAPVPNERCPRWAMTLQRAKGRQPLAGSVETLPRVEVEWNHETHGLRVVAPHAHGSCAAKSREPDMSDRHHRCDSGPPHRCLVMRSGAEGGHHARHDACARPGAG
jgi:hypothetical protein